MAIFQFVKQAGHLVSKGLEAAAHATTPAEISIEEIQSAIASSSVKPRDLALKKVDEDTVKVYAVVDTSEEMEQLILLVGNSQGVAQVENAIKVKPEGQPEVVAAPPRFYTVKSGDTLAEIAQRELGSAERYREIFEANRGLLSDPDSIDVGQTLRIPRA